MALDNIQKSILTVLGISGMVAFLTPSSMNIDPGTKKTAAEIESNQAVDPVPPLPPSPPQSDFIPPENNDSSNESSTPAFGEPTITGLPYNQAPEPKNTNPDVAVTPDSIPDTIGQINLPNAALPQGNIAPSTSYNNSLPVN
jgi:hypothetical protein